MEEKIPLSFWVISLFSSLFLAQCTGANNKAIPIIEKSIEFHGGWKAWEDLESVRFTKNSMLFSADGSIESEMEEKYNITLQPGFAVSVIISDSIHLQFDGKNYSKTISDLQAPITSADTSAIQASFFVISHPFSLAEENVILSLEGKDSILGREVFAVSARYGEAKKENHPWIFYMDTRNFSLFASRVYHPPTYALIVNEEMVTYKGILWNSQRTTYRVDSMNNILFVRAKYKYEFE